jgi:hypothetical protein
MYNSFSFNNAKYEFGKGKEVEICTFLRSLVYTCTP